MRNVSGKVEIVANILIIIVALLIGGILVDRYVFPVPLISAQQPTRIGPGTRLPLTGVDWRQSNKTLVMVLSTTCRFCTESIPFYQELSKRKIGRNDVRLLGVLPQSTEESVIFLKDHGISVDDVRSARPGDLQVNGTPALIVLDKDGKVVNSWVGKLPPEKEDEVILTVFGTSPGT